MIETYKQGQDLYAMMASKVFTLLADRTAKLLNDRHEDRGPITKSDLEDLTHGLAPIKQQLVEDGFIFISSDKQSFMSRALTPEDCYDGTKYRKTMKTLLLGMTYGMSEFGLAARLRISEEDAKDIIDDFYKAFPQLRNTMIELKKSATKTGYVETPWGRKRRIPDVWAEEKWIRRKAERQLFNSVIQGGAADITKRAMANIFYDPRLEALGFETLLSIHDEVIGQSPVDTAYEASVLMVDDMVSSVELKVPMKVDAELYYTGEWNGDSVSVKGGTPIYDKEVMSLEELDNFLRAKTRQLINF